MNRVILIGTLVGDPKTFTTKNGNSFAKGKLVVKESWEKNGVTNEKETFVDFLCFTKVTKEVGENLKDQEPVALEGRLSWQAGSEKYPGGLSVIVDSIQSLLPPFE